MLSGPLCGHKKNNNTQNSNVIIKNNISLCENGKMRKI